MEKKRIGAARNSMDSQRGGIHGEQTKTQNQFNRLDPQRDLQLHRQKQIGPRKTRLRFISILNVLTEHRS